MEGAPEVPWSQDPTNGAVLNNLNPFHAYILNKLAYLKYGKIFSYYLRLCLSCYLFPTVLSTTFRYAYFITLMLVSLHIPPVLPDWFHCLNKVARRSVHFVNLLSVPFFFSIILFRPRPSQFTYPHQSSPLLINLTLMRETKFHIQLLLVVKQVKC